MRSIRGFSLVETMLAILILGVGVAGLTQGITAALQATRESELQTKAALFAAGQIEIIRAEGFILEGETDGDCGPGLANYAWRQTIAPGSMEGLYDVELEVHDSETGKPVYTLKTLLFDTPITPTDGETPGRRDPASDRERRPR